MTGRRSVERSRPAEEQKLLGWVRQHPPGGDSFRTIMDPRLGGRYPLAAAREAARLADRAISPRSILSNWRQRTTNVDDFAIRENRR
uniref:Uncharacterized protein n=1 Tax=Aegilops tauschii TaxID=37682 RepID=M8BJ53_AEGTA